MKLKTEKILVTNQKIGTNYIIIEFIKKITLLLD